MHQRLDCRDPFRTALRHKPLRKHAHAFGEGDERSCSRGEWKNLSIDHVQKRFVPGASSKNFGGKRALDFSGFVPICFSDHNRLNQRLQEKHRNWEERTITLTTMVKSSLETSHHQTKLQNSKIICLILSMNLLLAMVNYSRNNQTGKVTAECSDWSWLLVTGLTQASCIWRQRS